MSRKKFIPDKNFFNTPGGRLYLIRQEKGWEQKDLANILGYSRSRLSDYESNKAVFSSRFLSIIELKLGIPKELLLTSGGKTEKGVYNQEGIKTGMISEYASKYQTTKETTMDQKLNIDDAMGKAYKILSSDTPYAVALYLNIMQFASALDVGREMEKCIDELKELKSQVNKLRQQVDRLSAVPTTADQPEDSSQKAAI